MTRLHQIQINIPPPASGDGREPGWKKNIHSENATRKIIRIDCVRTPRVGLLIRTFGGEQGGRFIVYKWGLPTKVTFVHNTSKLSRIFVRMDSLRCCVHGSPHWHRIGIRSSMLSGSAFRICDQAGCLECNVNKIASDDRSYCPKP